MGDENMLDMDVDFHNCLQHPRGSKLAWEENGRLQEPASVSPALGCRFLAHSDSLIICLFVYMPPQSWRGELLYVMKNGSYHVSGLQICAVLKLSPLSSCLLRRLALLPLRLGGHWLLPVPVPVCLACLVAMF